MNSGIVTTAATVDQVRLATCLAYSVGIHNKIPVTLLVPDLNIVADEYEEPFDKIIELPFRSHSENLRANDWQLYWASPYEETLFLDCHQLVKCNLETAMDYFSQHYDLYFPTQVRDFKYNIVPNFNHKMYSDYCDIRVYSNAIFFRKDSEIAMNYFKFMDPILKNWRDAFDQLIEKRHDAGVLDIDLLNSIVLHNLDIIDEVQGYPVIKIIDLESANNLFNRHIHESYLEYLNVWVTNIADVKIQNYKSQGLVNYVNPEFITEEIFNANRNTYREQYRVLDKV